MAIRRKKIRQSIDPVIEAQAAVATALESFNEARTTLEAATATYVARVDENNVFIDDLKVQNELLNQDADRAARVAAKLAELTV